MELKSGFITDRGRKRSTNEDSFLSNDRLGLYIVADGMGGHSYGDVASQTAIEVIRAGVELAKKKGMSGKDCEKVFLNAVGLANTAIWEMSSKMPGARTMGTTIAGIIVCEDFFISAHVGDSRIYRVRDGRMEQLTVDHSLVEEQVAIGALTREEARLSPRKNVITRALGMAGEVEADSKRHGIKDDDFILLCSDGLTSMVTDGDILDVILKEGKINISKALTALVEQANLNGGDDNVTAILVHFRA